ncbi:MAG: hypothetical protein WBD86_01355 [Microgenomates group bacterium]
MIKVKVKPLIIVFLVIVIAGAAWFFINRGDGAGIGSLTQKYSESNPFSGGLKAAVELGVPMKCSYEVNGVEYSGVIKGRQYKGKVKMQDGKEGNVLMKENCMYTWSDLDSQGIKSCFEEDDLSMWEQSGETTSEGAAPVDYTCYPALVPDSEFNLPSGVNFVDIDALMNYPDVNY